jgi:hypothetical protein
VIIDRGIMHILKFMSAFGAFVLVALVVGSFAGTPKSDVGIVNAATVLANGCSIQEVALDEGYGVSRKVLRQVCSDAE